jgi:uncharacterized protein YndB with AHSA1/START domain
MRKVILFAGLALLLAITPLWSAPQDPIVTEAIIDAPLAEVWQAFTTRDGIESWMVAKTDIDLRPGGLWRTSYSKDSNLNDDASIHQMILAYDPGRMLAFRTIKPPKNFPFPNAIAKTWTVTYFETVGDSRTKITAHMLGFGDDDESQKMRAFFERGNKTTLDNLAKKYK